MSDHYHDPADFKLLREMKGLAPNDFGAWVGLDKIVGRDDGAIPRKYRELIAIAVACTTQCPYCLAHVRVKGDGAMYAHDRGRPGLTKTCPGAGRTKDEAKVAKSEGVTTPRQSSRPDSSDPVDPIRPEDIF